MNDCVRFFPPEPATVLWPVGLGNRAVQNEGALRAVPRAGAVTDVAAALGYDIEAALVDPDDH